MTDLLQAWEADNLSDAIARHTADRWSMDYYPTSAGIAVTASRPHPAPAAVGEYENRDLGTLPIELCPVAAQLVRG